MNKSSRRDQERQVCAKSLCEIDIEIGVQQSTKSAESARHIFSSSALDFHGPN